MAAGHASWSWAEKFTIRNARPTGMNIGDSSYATLEKYEIDGFICAGKGLHGILRDRSFVEMWRTECEMVSQLRHPNIVQFLGIYFIPRAQHFPVILSELLRGNLHYFLEKGAGITLSRKVSVLRGVARALMYLHSRSPSVMHCSLTARKVLLGADMTAKVSVSGASKLVGSTKLVRVPGTLFYMPPEAFEDDPRYDTSLDMFSFGNLALFTAMQVFPKVLGQPYSIDHRTGLKVRQLTEIDRRRDSFSRLENLEKEEAGKKLVQLIKECLHDEPTKRPTARQALEKLGEIKVSDVDPAGRMDRFELEQALRSSETSVQQTQEIERLQMLYERAQQEEIEARGRVQEVEGKVQQATARAEEAERRAQQAEWRAHESAENARQAYQRAQKAASETQRARQTAEQAVRRAQQAASETQRARQTAEQAEQRAIRAEQSIQQATERARQAEWRAQEAVRSQLAQVRVDEGGRKAEDNQLFWVVSPNEVQLSDRKLGHGGWGEVMIGMFRGMEVAVKYMFEVIINAHNRSLFIREMNMASRVRHPNLVQFIGATMEGHPMILMELMPNSLRTVLEDAAEINLRIPDQQLVAIAVDVAKALNYLHLTTPHPILHRDISSANVLMEPVPAGWKAKVSDYGSANFAHQLKTRAPGSPAYAAPESLNPRKQSPKMDVFSFGVLLIEMFTHKFPDPDHRDEMIRNVRHRRVVRMIESCLKDEPTHRPTMSTILQQLTSF